MEKNMIHLAKITVANLKSGSINPTESEIISAMQKAVSKENEMGLRLLKSAYDGNDKLDRFAKIMSSMIYDFINSNC